jgi:hypothetical protein
VAALRRQTASTAIAATTVVVRDDIERSFVGVLTPAEPSAVSKSGARLSESVAWD